MATAAIAEKPLLVEVKGLRHYYSGQDHLVLDDVNLELSQGEIVGLLGRSGSGKSTLLRSIAGLIRPSEGIARLVPGPDVPDPSVAMVFQTFALFPWLTVLENVELGLEAQKIPAPQARARALAAIDLIGLDGFENAYPKELSGGMRQRVGLARALVVDPSLLLMDEPFSALDVLTAETLRTDLLDLWSEGRVPIKSILIVTHNIEEAVLMCDRILVFSTNPGRVVGEIRVDLPQPRDRLDPAFRALVDDIYARMTARTEITAPMRDGLFPGTGIAMVLPRVSTNSIAGLIEEVDGTPFEGRASMSELADSLQLEADELFPMAETLQLLRFAELRGAELVLTPAARRYAQGDVDQRKALFAQALNQHVPLVQHIRRVLDERASHEAPARRFRDELEDYMSEDYADETLRTVTLWGRYAEIFAYDEEADRFSLEDAR
ncbi:AAA-associated domain-containing protein [Novosphingobium sp. Fuku2-ISO-50]|jgi:NitT/TauT family transport system ATP-binding protein|uniref:ABC transporter ATP-binding protein n=1 Tax=Novosphingobium sp. Fuku2-ISO-50 TaxID=1739114 RepID=UPI00076CDF41|nr:nitrate/sulfonate/bicarbonate ABC transporter ATP-binding protein [Novosphingobium sp. Fuku2-ISO-50]KUR79988.1 nitrate ABC transporter ATP-binding protein [Novosphingobium sp. Fuku2-ISO-50]